ncbi:hypothetical protein Acr_00g0016990 [Actinidia rufa]|uniref:NB-ARC domain-containing disease resistance protein n=1 Tax=Actinidia rufa TaxID=165716 RepID=A0A7J0DB17_9ERIC|nr:hypothetical protein Acr_00g0016990 [Actinidia rufa]
MGDGAITFLLENLTRLLSQEADLLHGVEEEVRSLQTELKLIEPCLRDYGQKRNEPAIKTEFINQLRDAAREAEDIIDPYVASVAQQRGGNFLVRTKSKLQRLSSRRRVAEQIKDIKKRFEVLFKQKDKYEIQSPFEVCSGNDHGGDERMSNEDLGYELRRYLTSAMYMIVLDDVWKTDCWDELNQVFATNTCGSRIIITTQDESVARHVNEKPLKLNFLSEEKSWELFSKKVFPAKEEKFLEVRAFGSSYTLPPNSRRLGLHSSMLTYISSNPASSTLRSMLCFGPDERPLSLEAWKLLYKHFPSLRVFDAWIVGVEVIPNDIHKLLHLRYLTLKSPTAQTLPASISNLWNLQTLVVAAPHIDRPQLNIWKMKELRHLRFHGQLLLPEPPNENDSNNVSINLQTLYCISPDSCTERVFSMLPNLLKLGIHGNLEEHRLSKKFKNLSILNCLQTLKLERDRSRRKLDSLEYVVFPQNLSKLTLVETQLLADPMDILGQLPNLQVLILKNAAYNGRNLNCRSNGFPKLEVLKLINLAIRSWNISQGSMARLRSVVINRCGLLEGLPSALQNMPDFRELELSYHVQLVHEAKEIEKSRGKEHFKLVICQS